MNLIVHEFEAGVPLFQYISNVNPVDLWGIRPHLMKFGNPTGTITFKIYDQNDRLLKASDPINMALLGVGYTYWHGYYPIENKIDLPAGTWKFAIETGGGYVFAGGNYLGWCNDYDLFKYEKSYIYDGSSLKASMDMEIWSYQRRDNMRVLDFDDGFTSATQPVITDVALQQFIFQPIVNNQVAPADVTNMIVDKDEYHKTSFEVRVYRRTDTPPERAETVLMYLEYQPDAATWIMEVEGRNTESGVNFSIVGATGQVQYTSDNMAGAGHTGYIKWTKTSFDKE